MDLLTQTMLEHEKRIDSIINSFMKGLEDLINRLETLIKQLESQKPSLLAAHELDVTSIVLHSLLTHKQLE